MLSSSTNKISILTDNTSLIDLYDDYNIKYNDINNKNKPNSLIQLVEMLIFYDQINIDSILVDGLSRVSNIVKALPNIIIPIHIEDGIRVSAARQALSIVRRIPNIDTTNSYAKGERILDCTERYISGFLEKNIDMHEIELEDNLNDNEILELIYSSSDNYATRAMYYYYLSKLIGFAYVPYILRARFFKMLLHLENSEGIDVDEWLNGLDFEAEKAYKSIIQYVEEQGKKFKNELGINYVKLEPLKITDSSILAMTMNKSRNKNISIIEAALEIRESAEAKEFRKWLFKYQKAFKEDNYDEINKYKLEIANACKYWQSDEAILGYKNRSITVGSLIQTDLVFKEKIIKAPKFIDTKKHLLFLHDIWGKATL